MPLYEYKCSSCGSVIEAHRTVHRRNHSPKCCGQATRKMISHAYHVMPLFDPYRAIGGDRRYIRTRQEHKDFLREFNYEEVGNDPGYAPPPDDPDADAAKVKEIADSMKDLISIPNEVGTS